MSDQQASIPILELDDISARIPLLEKIGTDVLKLIQRRDEILGQTRSPGRGLEEKSPTLVELKEELRRLSRKLEAYREEVKELGGILAIPDAATMEFLGEIDGCLAWFSWQPGENSIDHWRPVDGDPGERIPLLVKQDDLDTDDLIYPLDCGKGEEECQTNC